MLPGFELRDAIIGKKLDFDVIRLESDENISGPDAKRSLEYRIPTDCTEDLQQVIDEYYERKPEILDYYSPGSTFSMRVYPQDAEVVSKKLASEMLIGFNDPVEAFKPNSDSEIAPQPYERLVGEGYEVSLDADWEMLSNHHSDIQAELEEATPEGIQSPDFSRESYNDFLTEFVFDPIERAGWSGGNAWLVNVAIHNLRNGRYSSAAYAFEGARHRLTKRSHWEDNRFRVLVNSCLESLRNLCMSHGEEGDPFGDISLNCRLENRDLIYYPNFVNEPSFGDPNFGFSTKSWTANSLVLLQAVAHVMEQPTISRREVDPFGSNLTHRNVSFVLKLSRELIQQDDLDREQSVGQDDHQTLQMIDFTEFSPDIALTRILNANGYQIVTYGISPLGFAEVIEEEYELIVESEDQKYIVRALRDEDRNLDQIRHLNDLAEDVDENIMLLFDQEVPGETIETIDNCQFVQGYYVDLVNERLRPVSSGYPRLFEDLTSEQDILSKIDELLAKAENAETTQEKGDSLEELMELIFDKAIPETEVRDKNVRTRVEEIDLQLHNKGQRYPWDELGSRIPVECKNWSETAGVDVIYTIFGKTQMMSPSCKGAILVSWEGISDTTEGRDGDQLVREIRQKDINLLVLDKDDLHRIVETGDVQSIFEEKADELWAR